MSDDSAALQFGTGAIGDMGNVAIPMIGNLLTLVTAVGAFGIGAVVVQNLLSRRVRVPIRHQARRER